MESKASKPDLWQRLAQHITKRRKLTLFAAACATLFCLSLIPIMPFSADPSEFLPTNNADVKFWLDLTKRFSAMDILMIGLEEPSEPLSYDGLARVARISDQLSAAKAQGILNVSSVTNVSSLREAGGTLNAELLVNSIPRSREERDKLIARINADTQVPGSLISRDLKGYSLFVRIDPRKDAREVAQFVINTIEKDRGDLKSYYFGAAFIAIQLTKHIYAQLGWLVPMIVVVLLGTLLITVRRPKAILVTLVSACVPILWWFGLASLLRIPLTASSMIVALFIPILASVLYARGLQRKLYSEPGEPVTPFGAREVLVLLALGVSCLIGLFVQAPFLIAFAWAASAGCLAILLFGLSGFTAVVGFFAPLERKPAPAFAGKRYAWALVLPLAALLLGLGLYGAKDQRFMMTPKDIFSEKDEIGRALNFYDRLFGGSDFLQIAVKGDLRDPGVMARVARLSDLLEGTGRFADLRSITQVVSFVGQQFGGVHRIPTDRDSLNNLWFFLEGQEDVKPMVSDARDEAMIAGRLPGRNPLTPDEWMALAEQAVRDSNTTGTEAARLRLKALAVHFGVTLPEKRIGEVTSLSIAQVAETNAAGLAAFLDKRLPELLAGSDSPFNPKPEEWAAVAAVLGDATKGTDDVAKAIAGLDSFKAAEVPEATAHDLAVMLQTRKGALRNEFLADTLVAALVPPAEQSKVPQSFLVRARGVLADWLDPAPAPAKEPVITVSGYPAMEAKMGGLLKHDILLIVAAMVVASTLLAWVLTRRSSALAAALLEALLVSSLTLGLGRFVGLYMDVASATVYILPGMISLLISPRLWREADQARNDEAQSYVFAFGLLGLPFLTTGIMPMVRLGGVLAIGMFTAWLVARLSARAGRR